MTYSTAPATRKTTLQKRTAHYVMRLYSGDMTAGEEAALETWLRADSQHRAEFNAQVDLMDDFSTAAESFHVPELDEQGPAPLSWRSFAISFKSIPAYGLPQLACVAAIFAVALVTTLFLTLAPDPEHSMVQRYATIVGGQDQVTLPDGSVLSLNTNTVLTVDFSGEDRLVTLEHGEVFFNIAKNKGRYFKVHAGSQTVTVLGTKFNVQKRGLEYTVAVVEGLVAVHPKGRLYDLPIQESAPKSADPGPLELTGQFRLKAGNVITYKDEIQLVSASNLASSSKYREWQTGIVTFNEETLADLVAELSRYTDKKVLIVDKGLEVLPISGVFHLRKIDDVITGLEAAFPLHILNQQDAILISRS